MLGGSAVAMVDGAAVVVVLDGGPSDAEVVLVVVVVVGDVPSPETTSGGAVVDAPAASDGCAVVETVPSNRVVAMTLSSGSNEGRSVTWSRTPPTAHAAMKTERTVAAAQAATKRTRRIMVT